jgi:hypothetical protein
LFSAYEIHVKKINKIKDEMDRKKQRKSQAVPNKYLLAGSSSVGPLGQSQINTS